MPAGDMARLFHRLTSYEPGREWTDVPDDPWLVASFEPNDLERMPPPVKEYPAGLPATALPRELPGASPGLDLAQLSRLLHLAAGVVRTEERPGGRTVLFRAAGSAGARFPLELYAVVPEGAADLPPGVHAYRPVEHELLQVGSPPAGGPPGLVVTGVPWRTGWRYRERGYRHVFWDAGTMLSQALALVPGARLYTEFPDVELRDLVGADGIHEFPVAALVLGDGAPGWTPAERGAAGEVDAEPVHFPLVTAAHWAGIAAEWGAPWPLEQPPIPGEATVDEVIYRRGSTRRLDPTRGLPHAAFDAALGYALAGIDLPHFLAVHDVEGVEPGIYRWPDLSAPVRAGELRAELRRVALGQGLAGDAAFVAIGAADIRSVSDRSYRELQLAAGLVEGRLHLAAFALGYGASGMTFLDSEIPGLVGEQVEAMLFTCVGVPEYRNRPGGPPGAPVPVRHVVPRLDD